MRKLNIILIATIGLALLTNWSRAQDTNNYAFAPATKLEALGTNIGTLIIKATTDVGGVSVKTGVVSVKAREVTDSATGRKEQGVAVEIARQDQYKETMLIDYDELNPLLNNIDYLSKVDVSVTALNTFDAAYTTKGGFRIAALGTKRTGLIQFAVRNTRTSAAPILISREEMTRLWSLIDQAKKQLEALGG